jgi:hypothetical protein
MGSLTHLMEEGRVRYAKGLITQMKRFDTMFGGTVEVIPFLPPPICGTNAAELPREMMDISHWLEKVQRRDLSAYYANMRHYLRAVGSTNPNIHQTTQRFGMPKSLEAYHDSVVMCHPWDNIGQSLPPMPEGDETSLVLNLLEGVNIALKWDLDSTPLLSRERHLSTTSTKSATNTVSALLIGGSNSTRLNQAFTDMGKNTVSMDNGGWAISRTSVEAVLPKLAQKLAELDPSVPVVIYCLDNSCFKVTNAAGDLLSISKSKTDKKYHVIGDLAVTPFSLLANSITELERLIHACGPRKVYILSPSARYLLMSCCETATHCANVRGKDDAALNASMKILSDLADLNQSLYNRLNKNNVEFVFTGDLLAGQANCSMDVLMEVLINCWSNDPVHGDKIAYTKLAMGLLSRFAKPSTATDPQDLRNTIAGRKRFREEPDSPPRNARGSDYDTNTPQYGGHNFDNRREDSRYGSAQPSKRDKYPGDYGGRGGRYNRGGGYRRFY